MKISFYEKDITPPLGCYMAGYYTNMVAEDVLDTLHVRCAVFAHDKQVAAVVSIDSMELPDDLHDAVTKRIEAYTGIPADSVLLSANHTHKGIPITDSPEFGACGDSAFRDVVYRLIADCVTLAYRRLQEGTVFYAAGEAEGVSFCRNFVKPDGTFVTWDSSNTVRALSQVDTEVPFLFVRDGKGKPCGAVVNFACHQDCLPVKFYSGDYAHVLSDELKKVYGPEFVTVFLMGTCGDINHIDPSQKQMPFDTYQTIGKTLAKTVCRHAGEVVPVGDALAVSKKQFPVRRRLLTNEEYFAESARLAQEKKLFSVRNLAFYHACAKTAELQVWLQCIRIGNAVLYGYPGEAFVDFGRDLKKRSPSSMNLVASQCNSCCGYIATEEAHGENSRLYEKDLCFGACLEPETGYRINDALLAMAQML